MKLKEKFIVVNEYGGEPLYIRMSEGDGTNLWAEEIEEGYLDYIMYEVYAVVVDGWEFKLEEIDGGEILLEEYVADMTDQEFINTVLDFVFVSPEGEEPPRPHYEVIEK